MSLLDSNIIALSLLQTAKSQLELLMRMVVSNTSNDAVVTMAEAFTKTVDSAIKIRQAVEVAETASLDTMSVAESVEPADVEAAPVPKTWSVHDCHTYHKKGEWVATAIADGEYGIGIAPTVGKKPSKDSANEKIMGPLGEVVVSKKRWAAAKGISVGDTLFMGDTHGKKVYKGLVTAQPVAGPFCPLASADNSFRLKFGAGPSGCYDDEVEVSFKVDWVEVGSLTKEWYDYLGTGRLVTVSPLTSAPPS